jgi:hypothetical protein
MLPLTIIPEFREEPSSESLKAFLDENAITRLTIPDESELSTVAEMLGKPLPSHRNGDVIEVLTVTASQDTKRNSMSSRFGTGAVPFHTDQAFMRDPARYVILYHRPPLSCRPTLAITIDPRTLSLEDHDCFLRGVWRVATGSTAFYTSLLDERQASAPFRLRYDPCIMNPVCSLAKKAAATLERIIRTKPLDHYYSERECLILDNWRTLHGRGIDTNDEGTRQLLRISIR